MKSTPLFLAVAFGAAAVSPAGGAPSAGAPTRVVLADDGVPAFVRGALDHVDPSALASDPDAALRGALPALAGRFGVPATELRVAAVQRDDLGMTHVRYAQTHRGLRVVGGELVVHVGADGTVRTINGGARALDGLDGPPAITVDGAIAAARPADAEVFASELVYVMSTRDGRAHLAWEIGVRATRGEAQVDLVYVDAYTGAIVDRHPLVFTARSRTIYDGQGKSPPFFGAPGPKLGSEGSPPTTDDTAKAAFDNTGKTYDCYKTLYGRDSYDNQGAGLTSVVHVVFQTPSGTTTGNNAAWISFPQGEMVYGDGDGKLMGPTAKGFDVTAHELTHAVTSTTAMLAYQNEPGALNEGMSDIMAARCEAWRDGGANANTWMIGEEIFTPGKDGDALRYMNNPTLDKDLYPPNLGGSRDFYADRFTGSDDNGGVHLNSGIANLAFYLLSQGGVHPRQRTTFTVPGIGIDKAGAIFERALVMGYLTSNASFANARTATEMAAQDLYSAAEVDAVSTAWAAVGVGQPPAPDTTPPTVAFTSPADGATVDPGFAIAVTATDDKGVLGVTLTIDGAAAGSDVSAPYTFTTDASLAPGPHTLTATATDGTNQASASITVTVRGPAGSPDAGTTGGDAGTGSGHGENGNPSGGCGCATGRDPTGTMLVLGAVIVALRRRRRAR